jgi:hypothetical protein
MTRKCHAVDFFCDCGSFSCPNAEDVSASPCCDDNDNLVMRCWFDKYTFHPCPFVDPENHFLLIMHCLLPCDRGGSPLSQLWVYDQGKLPRWRLRLCTCPFLLLFSSSLSPCCSPSIMTLVSSVAVILLVSTVTDWWSLVDVVSRRARSSRNFYLNLNPGRRVIILSYRVGQKN